MIISHTHRYLFVELPHTASTAVGRELCTHYDGKPILRKHARYHEFLRNASADERTYFVFSGIRNPLDEAVSMYLKYKTNHRGNYTNPSKLRRNGGHVTGADLERFHYIRRNNAEFPDYLWHFYRRPYDNWSSLAHHTFNFIIRFERLQDDFARLLQQLGIEQRRPLPTVNPTAEKERHFSAYYTPDVYDHARWIFGPFMKKWGYSFPPKWGTAPIPRSSQVLFRALTIYRRLRWRYVPGK
jgi:hypothetical protein